MKEQNEKNLDKKTAEVHEKLTDEVLDRIMGGETRPRRDKKNIGKKK